MSYSKRPHGLQPTRLLHPWDSLGKSTGVGCHCLLLKNTTIKHIVVKLQKIQLNSRKINDPIKKWAKELNRRFSKENIQMGNKHMKRCSTSLIITHYLHQRNANQNYNKVLPQTNQNGHHQKSINNKC